MNTNEQVDVTLTYNGGSKLDINQSPLVKDPSPSSQKEVTIELPQSVNTPVFHSIKVDGTNIKQVNVVVENENGDVVLNKVGKLYPILEKCFPAMYASKMY